MADTITIPLSISEADVQRIAEAVAQRLARRPDELLTLEQAAAECGSSVRTLRRKIERGELPAEKLNVGGSSRLRIRRSALLGSMRRARP